MSTWGPWCIKCGHPASYHRMSDCLLDAGTGFGGKQKCDCDGYLPSNSVGQCPESMRGIGDTYLRCDLDAGHLGSHRDPSGAIWQSAHVPAIPDPGNGWTNPGNIGGCAACRPPLGSGVCNCTINPGRIVVT